jgi:hypothetical protein
VKIEPEIFPRKRPVIILTLIFKKPGMPDLSSSAAYQLEQQ